MKTYSAKPADVNRTWHIIDASEAPLGRISTKIATTLTGKDKPMYTPHIDCGDYVVVINAAKLVVTGGKETKKIYYRHSGFPGGIKDETLQEKINKDPTEVIRKSVYGMIPANKLRAGRMARLKVYSDSEHTHDPQQPKKLSVKEGK